MLKKYKKKAQKYLDDPQLTQSLIQKSQILYKKNKSKIKDVKDDFQVLLRLLKAWAQKKYNNVRPSTIIWIVAGLLYFINPLDLIPDFILNFGFVDDVTMIGLVISALKKEIQDFKSWEKLNSNESTLASQENLDET